MQRLKGWEERLNAVFREWRRAPHAWGSRDCLLFPCAAVEALLGVDLAAQWRGKYSDERGALRLLRRVGGADLEVALPAIAAARAGELGSAEVTQRFARRGDVAAIEGLAHQCLAVVDPSGRALAAFGLNGLERMPLERGLRFWSVG